MKKNKFGVNKHLNIGCALCLFILFSLQFLAAKPFSSVLCPLSLLSYSNRTDLPYKCSYQWKKIRLRGKKYLFLH